MSVRARAARALFARRGPPTCSYPDLGAAVQRSHILIQARYFDAFLYPVVNITSGCKHRYWDAMVGFDRQGGSQSANTTTEVQHGIVTSSCCNARVGFQRDFSPASQARLRMSAFAGIGPSFWDLKLHMIYVSYV